MISQRGSNIANSSNKEVNAEISKPDLPILKNSVNNGGISPISKQDKTHENILDAIAILMKELDETGLNSLKKDIELKLSIMGKGIRIIYNYNNLSIINYSSNIPN